MYNQNVNLAGVALTPEEQARLDRAQAMQAAGAAPIDVQSYKGIQAPVSGGEAIAKVLQSYMGARQKDAILNNAMGNTGMSVGDTNYAGGGALDAITGNQINKPKPSMDFLKNMFAGS
jgi:hypothetical protein